MTRACAGGSLGRQHAAGAGPGGEGGQAGRGQDERQTSLLPTELGKEEECEANLSGKYTCSSSSSVFLL